MRRIFFGFLDFCGRNGVCVLAAGALAGILCPAAAAAAKPVMGIAVFVFMLGAFLKADGAMLRAEIAAAPNLVRLLLWASLGVPLVTLGIVTLAELPEGIEHGMILAALAPPAGSVAAVAAIFGLNPALALLAIVVPTALSPVYLPPLAEALTGDALSIDPTGMALKLAVIVGGAAAVAELLRRYAPQSVARNPQAMTGIAVFGLVIVAIGAMDGMAMRILAAPATVAGVILLAFTLNLGFQALGAALFFEEGRARALTLGLLSGNRNVTLVWAASAGCLVDRPDAELFLAAATVGIFVTPLIVSRPIRAMLNWPGQGAGPRLGAPQEQPIPSR